MRVSSLLIPTLLSLGLLSVWACTSTTVVEAPPAATTDAGSSSGEDGSSGSSGGDEDVAPKPTGPMTLTSTEWENGGTFPTKYTCNGDETKSPPLSWTPGPEGTLSYAIVFNDTTLSFLHSAIYDIPADVTSLPEGVEAKYEPATPAGAKQAVNYKKKSGFVGPCPPKPRENTYELTLYALKVEKLAGLTSTSDTAKVQAAAIKQQLGTAKLTGKYKQP